MDQQRFQDVSQPLANPFWVTITSRPWPKTSQPVPRSRVVSTQTRFISFEYNNKIEYKTSILLIVGGNNITKYLEFVHSLEPKENNYTYIKTTILAYATKTKPAF